MELGGACSEFVGKLASPEGKVMLFHIPVLLLSNESPPFVQLP